MFCDKAKEYLSQKKIQFQDRDVTHDVAALDDLKRMGCMTTPVIQINDAVIVGFDRAKIDAALQE